MFRVSVNGFRLSLGFRYPMAEWIVCWGRRAPTPHMEKRPGHGLLVGGSVCWGRRAPTPHMEKRPGHGLLAGGSVCWGRRAPTPHMEKRLGHGLTVGCGFEARQNANASYEKTPHLWILAWLGHGYCPDRWKTRNQVGAPHY